MLIVPLQLLCFLLQIGPNLYINRTPGAAPDNKGNNRIALATSEKAAKRHAINLIFCQINREI